MAINDIVQTIAEARVDARSLSEFVFKPTGFKVARRLAPTIDTLQFYIDRFDATKATADAYVATIPTIVNNAINNTAVEGGVLADTFVTMTKKTPDAIARNLRDVNSDIVSSKDFGAVGDGVADDTDAIEKTFTYASENNARATIAAGDYRITRPIIITGDVDITFSTGANLRIEGLGYVKFGGSQSFVGTTANAITKGDKRIYISGDISSINNGDSLCLWDDTPYSLSNVKSSYWKGEFVTVKNVGANYVEVMASVQDDYDVSVTKVYFLDLANVSVDGLSAVGEHVSKPYNIIFDFCKNLKLSNPSVHGGGNSALAIRRTYGADITAGDISKNETGGSSEGTEYALSIANCQDIRVYGGTYRSHRHAITIGGSGSIDCAIANRGILIDGVNADCHLATCGALDSHGNTAEARFVNCKTRGMWLGGGDITVDGCEITDTTTMSGNAIKSQGFHGGTFTIRNTRIVTNLGDIDTASIVQINSLNNSFKKDFTVILDNVDISGTTNGSNISEIFIESGTDGDALPDGLKFNLISSDVTSNLKSSRAVVSLVSMDNKKINSDIIKAVNYKWISNTHPLRLYNCDTNAKVLELPSVVAYRSIVGDGTNTLTPLGGFGIHNGRLPLTGIERNVSVTASIVARHKRVPDGDTLEQYTGGGIMSVIVGEVLFDRTYFIVKSTEVIPTGSIFDVYLTIKYVRI